MMFVLRMAARETRSSWRRLLFFFVCIAVGVAAIVALRSVIQTVRGVIGREARSLIAADVLIDTTRDWTPEARQKIDERLAEAASTQRTETIETPTMVRSAGGGFRLGPRVLVDDADMPSTELLGYGSRARRTVMAKVPDERIQPLFRSLRRDFRDNFVNVRSYRANDDQVGRDFDRAENYLSL